MNFNNFFKEKKILITGASKGLGWVCAKTFESWGSKLVITGRSLDKLIKLQNSFTKPNEHLAFSADLLNLSEIHSLVDRSNEFLGEVNIIIHTAGGGYGFRDPLLSWEQFEKLHRINLGSAAEINRLIIPHMLKKKKEV